MTRALVAVSDPTYGGVYISTNIDFTDLTTQPTWTKMSTTGLANTLIKVMRVDPENPYDNIYLQLDNDNVYRWNGVSWTLIMTLADAQVFLPGGDVGYIATNQITAGKVYWAVQTVGQVRLLYSSDYGATWSADTVDTDIMTGDAYVAAYGDNIVVCTGEIYRMAYTGGIGSLWPPMGLWNNSGGGATIRIDPADPQYFYYRKDSSDADLIRAGLATITEIQNGYSLASNIDWHEHMHWIDPTNSAHHRILRSLSNNVSVYSTTDSWATFVDSTPTVLKTGFIKAVGALHCARENPDYCMFGVTEPLGTQGVVEAFVGDNPTASYIIAGTNWNTSPYTNAIPYTADAHVAFSGIWVGEGINSAQKGIYVYSVETGVYDYDHHPMIGDRSAHHTLSYPDEHAEDVQKDTPYIHTPFPTGNDGYGIIEVGGKWINTNSAVLVSGATGDNGILAETGNQVELDGLLLATDKTAGLLEGFRLIGENEAANPAIACGGLGASDNFIREPGNVLYEPNETIRKYKTFYTGYSGTYEGAGANEKIHFAYSEDGKTWTKYASNPVISVRAEDPYLIRVNGVYYLYVEDKQNQGAGGLIRRYSSTNCTTWTDDGQITGLTNCQSPIVWREGATWYLLYENWPTAPLDIRLATSSDGLAWTADPTNPVFSAGDTAWAATTVVPDDIFKVGSTYYMTYHGDDGGGVFHEAVAKSTNLTAWTDLGQIAEDTGDTIQHAQIFYDTRFTFLYWNLETAADTYGIYRGYPLTPILTESSDAITVNGDRYYVAAQTGTTDNLSTINGGAYGQFLVLQADAGDTITVKHNVGNIWINNLADAVLTGNNSILLFWDGSKWSTDGIQAAVTLDSLSDVDTTGTVTGDIIYNDAGTWKDYPLGIGSKVSVTSNKLRFGNSSGGNYLEIDLSTGNLRLVGSATAWDDFLIAASVTKPGATAPSYKAFGPSGGLQALMFEAGHHDEVHFEVQLPHRWKEGSKIYPHVHWTPTDTTAGNVVWELEYSWANISGAFGAPGNMASAATAAGGTAWVHKMTKLSESGNDYIDGTGKTMSSMLVCRLHRNSNAGSDTLNKDVALLDIDFHIEIDSFGSDEELVKDATSALLLETGDYLLLENGDNLLME